MSELKRIALLYAHNGILSVGSIEKNSGFVVEYSSWRSDPLSAITVCEKAWNALSAHSSHMHILTGVSSAGNLCCIDIDVKNDPFRELVGEFLDLTEIESDNRVFIEKTKSGGMHIWFKSSVELNTGVLAYHNGITTQDAKVVYPSVIEMKANNGMCRAFPSNGISTDDQRMLYDLPIVDEETIEMWKATAEYTVNRRPHTPATTVQKIATVKTDGTGRKPGDHYNSDVSTDDLAAVFEKHGWTIQPKQSSVRMRRPGAKTKGIDADIKRSNNTVIVYSTSTEFDPGAPYSPFAAFAVLEHGGNFSAASKALAAEGWGDPFIPLEHQHDTSEHAEAPASGNAVKSKRIGLDTEVKNGESSLSFVHVEEGSMGKAPVEYPIGGPEQLVVISGAAKSRKTTVATSMAASFLLGGQRIAGWKFRPLRNGKIAWFDTEQPLRFAKRTYTNILRQGPWFKSKQDPEQLMFFCQRHLSIKERLAEINTIISENQDIEVVVIDGIKDLVVDFVGDNKEADQVISSVMRWSTMHGGIAVIVMIHINPITKKGDMPKLRGTLGTELTNKCDSNIRATLPFEGSTRTDISFPVTRDKTPPPYSFSVDENNVPTLDSEQTNNIELTPRQPEYTMFPSSARQYDVPF